MRLVPSPPESAHQPALGLPYHVAAGEAFVHRYRLEELSGFGRERIPQLKVGEPGSLVAHLAFLESVRRALSVSLTPDCSGDYREHVPVVKDVVGRQMDARPDVDGIHQPLCQLAVDRLG